MTCPKDLKKGGRSNTTPVMKLRERFVLMGGKGPGERGKIGGVADR